LRTAEPPLSSVENKKVFELRRIGKCIAIGCEDNLWLLIHLMIAGRLHWRSPGDPHLFSGIGNAYSDEILFRAQLSPAALTQSLTPDKVERLYRAVRETLSEWVERLRRETGGGFPERVTAVRKGMAVHGRFRQPCLVCGSPVQGIRYATNQSNYCARCQTGGRLLADRALSRLLKKDWPGTIEELEKRYSPPAA